MGIFDRMFQYAQEVVTLTREVKGLGDELDKVSGRQQEMDRRLVRVETFIEMAQEHVRNRRMDR